MSRPARWLTVALGAVLLVFYVVAYPLHGYRVSIGSDTPVYVWWARLAGVTGLGPMQTGSRPGIVGLMATLGTVTSIPLAGVAAGLAPLLASAMGLAAAAFVEVSLGRDRLRYVLVALMAGTYASLLTDGYLSTLAFGSALIAAMACFAGSIGDRTPSARASLAAGGLLICAGGLFHPLFLELGAAVLAGGVLGLVPAYRRDRARGASVLTTDAVRITGAALGGAALATAGVLLSSSGQGPSIDTSRDSILRRSGLGGLLRDSYVRKLRHDFPWYRSLVVVGLGIVPLILRRATGHLEGTSPDDPNRAKFLWGTMFAWLIVSAGGVGLLLAGTAAPGQRLAGFCIALPILGAIGLGGLRHLRDRRGTAPANASRGRSGVIIKVSVVTLAGLFVALAWTRWLGVSPLVTPELLSEARTAGEALGAAPAGTPLIVVMDDRSDKPGLFVTRDANYIRDAVPAARVPDVHVFLGSPRDLLQRRPSISGQAEHDRLAREQWATIAPLLANRALHPLVVSVRAFDPAGYAATSAIRGGAALGPGVIALPPYPPAAQAHSRTGDPALTDPGAGPQSPWLPALAGFVLLAVSSAIGWPYARVALANNDDLVRLSLAPAIGLAAIGLSSVIFDSLGLRLGGAGGWAAGGAALAVGWGLLGLERLRLRREATLG